METAVGKKITLGEARASGADGILVSCERDADTAGGCRRQVQLTMMHALTLWGPEKRIDELALYCSDCGSRVVEVRPHYPHRPSNGALERVIREA